MAERITEIKRLKKSYEQIKQESLNDVIDAIVENKDSILKAIRLIGILDEAKILDALNGGLKARQVIINKFAVELNKDIYSGVLTNMAQLVFLLGELDVKDLSELLSRLNRGIHAANLKKPGDKTTIKSLVGFLRDDDLNRSMTYMLNLLRGMSSNN
ncbi:DUF1641 domain-containing protein [Staphylococcus epidermidis]|uniref:DUF1641 domain-containing protein n=1 Tax=Staphylococcus epidermidis TaxID=1282 RepID=UPI0001A95CBE|nr:DUF1641 domain-containing protein [Staphylococcus epidermidis]EES34977.1 hypothetical protein HMPREF0791_2415 [Staphylococcus epidermidis W23144]EJD87955.1 hypothetical protein HMPREF9990_09065 [Staphylococcus epidermidis NIHLM061]MBF2140988.1 DUF1641 domain-containing protein [Staphylococcus epidermidis]MBF2213903.1 DUF1641 domain-containing protein [Staphylococcus epidermidis]MBF2226187.1 DUF1641 domain-containing protein [Staphylococcus epidermidis]